MGYGSIEGGNGGTHGLEVLMATAMRVFKNSGSFWGSLIVCMMLDKMKSVCERSLPRPLQGGLGFRARGFGFRG